MSSVPAQLDDPLTDQHVQTLSEFLRRECGLVVPPHKRYLYEQRLGPLRTELHMSWDAFVRACGGGQVRRDVVHAMTTHETSFFRDQHPFDTLTRTLLPEIIARTAKRRREGAPIRPFTVWSAACSTGQEAYSIAMLIMEAVESLPHCGVRAQDLRILGTDISRDVIATARAGRFSGMELRGLDAKRRAKYCIERPDGSVEMRPELKQMITFRELTLTGPLTLGPFELIMCRNVLIYFDLETRVGVTERISKCLDSTGHLILGASEAVDPGLDKVLQPIQHGRTRCYTKPRRP